MSISNAVRGIGAVALLATLSTPALAGPSEALAGCKSEIANDSRLSQFETVRQNTDSIKRRGRYTSFEIEVAARNADGGTAEYVATCKARGNGTVDELELVQVGGAADTQVAQTK
ncbi:MAG: hypothetical protein QNI86_01575 [Halieaceae bacterium]|nr:hypothetical protein [Halieaceae bacterium]